MNDDGFYAQNDRFCTKIDGSFTKNHGFCTETDAFGKVIAMAGFIGNLNGGEISWICIENDELCAKNQ